MGYAGQEVQQRRISRVLHEKIIRESFRKSTFNRISFAISRNHLPIYDHPPLQ